MNLKEQTIHTLHGSNKAHHGKYKTTSTKQAKEILDIAYPKWITCRIKENIELQMEDICFEW